MSMRERVAAAFMKREASPITDTIVQQLGGAGRIQRMLGTRPAIVDNTTIGIRWPARQRSRGNYMEVAYNEAMDYYKVTFYNQTSTTSKVVKVIDGVYNDQLVDIFEKQTGWVLY